jgi:hypothetical protein
MADHPTGNPDLIQQHKAIQRQGDQELKGGETKGKEAPGLEDDALPDALPEERSAGVVQPHDGSRTRLPSMKPATEPEIEGEAGGEGSTGAGPNPGP